MKGRAPVATAAPPGMAEALFRAQPSPAEIRRRMGGFGAWLEIDLDRIGFNLAAIRTRVGAGVEIMPVVKNNAYGHGLLPIVAYLESQGIRWVMVAKRYEAEWIRQAGFAGDIVSMDAVFSDDAAERLVAQGITQVVHDLPVAERLSAQAGRQGRVAGVFVKVDTGLRRIGVRHDEAAGLVQALSRLPHLRVAGIFSTLKQHPDEDAEMAARFQRVDDELRQRGLPAGVRSLASSHSIFQGDGRWFDMVRPAISLFGVCPDARDRDGGLEVRQAIAFRARLEQRTWVEAGESVTYFGRFVAPRRMRIGTLHVGFYDGVPREMANKARLLVDGVYRSSLGSVSLNHLLVDLTDVRAEVGDVVTVIGQEGDNDVAATAATAGWMVYSLLNHLNPFTPRVYFRAGAPVALLDLSAAPALLPR